MAKKTATEEKKNAKRVTIPPPNFKVLLTTIVGTEKLVQNRFAQKKQNIMREKQEAGSTANKGGPRTPRDFQDDFEGAYYKAPAGWYGFHAAAFRNAMIDACRACGFKMTLAKMSIFILADGNDVLDGTPLVRISKSPVRRVDHVNNATGVCDLRSRAEYTTGWEVELRIRYDGDQFNETDIMSLLMRAGIQVGVGCGRPYSKQSNGLGWGTFEIKAQKARSGKRKARISVVAS